MLKRFYLGLLCLGLLSCTSEPIYNAVDKSISPNPKASDAQISAAIWLAGRRQGWEIEKLKPGEIIGIFKKREHTAVVSIYYDRNKFSVIYLNSINLDYDSNKIHRNYNVWISNLEKEIQKEIKFRLP